MKKHRLLCLFFLTFLISCSKGILEQSIHTDLPTSDKLPTFTPTQKEGTSNAQTDVSTPEPKDGSLSYWSLENGNWSIFTFNISDGSNEKIIETSLTYYYPAIWSPDYSELAFIDKVNDKHQDIFIYDISNKQVENITANSTWASFPDWSPDGKHLAYHTVDGGSHSILVYDLLTKEKRTLCLYEKNLSAPVWSPDGKKIAVIQWDDEISQVALCDIATGELTVLTNFTESGLGYPLLWSPNGRYLSYIFYENDDNSSLMVFDLDQQIQLNVNEHLRIKGKIGNLISWSPDGSELAFHAEVNGDNDIYLFDLESLIGYQITEYDGLDYSPVWSPDGKFIAFVSTRNYQSGYRDNVFIYSIETKDLVETELKSAGAIILIDWLP